MQVNSEQQARASCCDQSKRKTSTKQQTTAKARNQSSILPSEIKPDNFLEQDSKLANLTELQDSSNEI
jgi:hypothetical protein